MALMGGLGIWVRGTDKKAVNMVQFEFLGVFEQLSLGLGVERDDFCKEKLQELDDI